MITDQKDFDATYDCYNSIIAQLDNQSLYEIPWVLTPCYETEEEFPMERFSFVQNVNIENGSIFRVIGQQHKWIYGADRKQV